MKIYGKICFGIAKIYRHLNTNHLSVNIKLCIISILVIIHSRICSTYNKGAFILHIFLHNNGFKCSWNNRPWDGFQCDKESNC